MKQLMILALTFSISTVFAAPAPVCDGIGTESEGWYLNGELIKDYRGLPALDKCADKAAECSAIGTPSEGWHTFVKKDARLLAWARCGESESKPVCESVGTLEEGWYLEGQPLESVIGQPALMKCAGKHVECGSYGRAQAWLVYEKEDRKLLAWAKCSERL